MQINRRRIVWFTRKKWLISFGWTVIQNLRSFILNNIHWFLYLNDVWSLWEGNFEGKILGFIHWLVFFNWTCTTLTTGIIDFKVKFFVIFIIQIEKSSILRSISKFIIACGIGLAFSVCSNWTLSFP
jgi:hypothetical protein